MSWPFDPWYKSSCTTGFAERALLPYTALAGVDTGVAGSKLALAQENTVSSNGPMRAGWGCEQQRLEEYQKSSGYWPLAQVDKTTGLLVGVIFGGYVRPAPHALFTASTHRTLVSLHYCSHGCPVPVTAGESKPQDVHNVGSNALVTLATVPAPLCTTIVTQTPRFVTTNLLSISPYRDHVLL